MYPVLISGKGGVVLLDQSVERTAKLSDVDLMQYSGVVDTNGQDIYEGDVVEVEHDGFRDRKHVSLEDGSFRLIGLRQHHKGPRVLTSAAASRYKIRVIGNIYELRNS